LISDDYELPTKNIPPSLHHFRKKVIELMTHDPDVDRVISRLATGSLDRSAVCGITAVKRYLIAIYIYSKLPILAEQEGMPVAQLCLQLAWVIRDMHKSGAYDASTDELKAIRRDLTDQWRLIPLTETAALELAINYYDTAIYQSMTLVEQGIEYKVQQQIARINVRLKRFKVARQQLFDTVMKGNKQIAGLKKSLRPQDREVDRQHNKNIMDELCRINAFVKETKTLLEFCSTLK